MLIFNNTSGLKASLDLQFGSKKLDFSLSSPLRKYRDSLGVRPSRAQQAPNFEPVPILWQAIQISYVAAPEDGRTPMVVCKVLVMPATPLLYSHSYGPCWDRTTLKLIFAAKLCASSIPNVIQTHLAV